MRLSELPDIYCLGVKALGSCSYDLSNPSLTFFSIGQLATVVALIFAFSQLAKPIVKFRIATRFTPYWVPWVGIALAILSVFAAAILRAWQFRDLPVVGYPIFWEFVAGAFLVWASLLMIFRVTSKTRLSIHNAARYLQWSQSIIARGNVDDLREYGDEISISLSTAVKACKCYEVRSMAAPTTADEKVPPTEFEGVCYTLLDLWADRQFSQILVTRCPQTAVQILLEVQNCRLYDSGAYALVQELVGQAMSNLDSILHREGGYSGLGRLKSFMSTAFGNPDFVNSRQRPLQAWQAYSQDRISPSQVKLYGNAIDIALRAVIEEHRTSAFYAALSSALHVVNGIAQRAAWAMNRISEGELSQSEWSTLLYECGNIHSKVIATIASLPAEQQPSTQVANIDAAAYDPIKDHSIFGAIARKAYEYVESLAICRGHGDTVRLDAIFLWDELFPHGTTDSYALNAVRQRFVFALREKIDENLDTEHWYYPVVTRVLMAMWGIPDCPSDVQPLSNCSREESELYVYLYTKIKQNYVAIRRKSLEYANDLLPQRVDYVEQPQSLRQTWFRGNATALSLIDPSYGKPNKTIVL